MTLGTVGESNPDNRLLCMKQSVNRLEKRCRDGLKTATSGRSGESFQPQPSCCMLMASFHIFVMCVMRSTSKTIW